MLSQSTDYWGNWALTFTYAAGKPALIGGFDCDGLWLNNFGWNACYWNGDQLVRIDADDLTRDGITGKWTYAYGDDGHPYAARVDTTAASQPAGVIDIGLLTDASGSVVELLDKNGAWFATYAYDPLGNVVQTRTRETTLIARDLAQKLARSQALRFHGMYYCASLDAYWDGLWYDPTTGKHLETWAFTYDDLYGQSKHGPLPWPRSGNGDVSEGAVSTDNFRSECENVRSTPQRHGGWCFLASGECAIKSLHSEYSNDYKMQDEMAKLLWPGRPASPTMPPPLPAAYEEVDSLGELWHWQQAMNHWGVNAAVDKWYSVEPFDWDTLVRVIQADQPVIIGVNWTHKHGMVAAISDHAMVLYGVQQYNGVRSVLIMDPWTGQKYPPVSFEQACRSAGTFIGDGTIKGWDWVNRIICSRR
jgi:hypothetical protein